MSAYRDPLVPSTPPHSSCALTTDLVYSPPAVLPCSQAHPLPASPSLRFTTALPWSIPRRPVEGAGDPPGLFRAMYVCYGRACTYEYLQSQLPDYGTSLYFIVAFQCAR
jgi:hypothetical protein